MIYLLPAHLITDELIKTIVDKLENKTDLFKIKDKNKYIKDLKDGKLVVWLHNKAVIIGSFYTTETELNTLSLTVVNVTDEPITDFEESFKQLEQEVKKAGVDRIVLDGRKGWQKIYPNFKVSSVVLSKDI